MDSQFVNFDGRSVHDVLQILLAASGDPEAIARLQQAIQTVDAKFGPVNDELERLEDDKQDTGNYITDNVESTVANISKAMIANVDSGYDIQINNTGEGNVDVDWLRFIFKGSAAKQIAATIRRNGTWETAARWSADEDTGWLTLEIDTTKWTGGDLRYRKKNGIVFMTMNAGKPAENITGGQHIKIATLPIGYRPTWASQYGALWMRTASGNIPCEFLVGPTGDVYVRPSQAVTAASISASYGTVSFPTN